MLSIKDIKIILKINEVGNLSNAAKTLYLSQPTIVKNLKRIESELGYKIFSRNRGQQNSTLTSKGLKLIPLLQDILDTYDKALSIKNYDNINFSIASSDGPYLCFLNDILLDLHKEFPNVSLKLKVTTYKNCVESLIDNSADVAFLGNKIYNKDIIFKTLLAENFVVITSKNYDDNTDWSNLSSFDLKKCIYSSYSSEFSSWFKNIFKNSKPPIQCDLIEQVIFFLDNLEMWSIVPKSVATYISKKTQINIYDFPYKIPTRNLYYARRLNEKNLFLDMFVEFLITNLNKNSNKKWFALKQIIFY